MNQRSNWAAVFDFDGTLISSEYTAAFVVLMQHPLVSDVMVTELEDLTRKYIGLYRSDSMSLHDEIAWVEAAAEIFSRHELREQVIDDVFSGVAVRPGVRECWVKLRRRGVPIGVVSYGFAPFIRSILRQNGLLEMTSGVMAQELIFDDAGRCSGWTSGSAAIPRYKGLRSVAFASAYGVNRGQILAVGDSSGDKNLGHLKRYRLGVVEKPEDVSLVSPYMGEVIVDPDFTAVADWLFSKIDG